DPTPAADRLQVVDQRKNLRQNSLLATLDPHNIGPSIFSCRVTDVDADPADPTHFYVAYASGGLWYTESNGTRFQPVFDHEASLTIGDIAVDWRNNVLWVGTGEANSSRSSYAGTGIYRSANSGKTWQNRGLPESHHIARIILHPTDSNTLWVAVLGHLYSPNAERGVYKTTDGGQTWTRTLFVDENSGAIDLCLDPNDPNTLYASTWQRERRAWNFSGAGSGSGIWKSTDGGSNWQKISIDGSGFPTGDKIGRIGLCAGKKDGRTVLYASLDNQNSKDKKDKKAEDGLSKDQLRSMSKADFLKLDDEKLAAYLKTNDFPEKYTPKQVREMVEADKLLPSALVDYLEDANNNLFETDYKGAELYRSDDGGKTWQNTHAEPLDGIHFTYGYYFSNVRCAAENADQVYLLGFLIIRSSDGGKTWKSINGENVHVDHHALWLDPAHPNHLINGNDGGLNQSWDNGTSWSKANNPPVGQFYGIATDDAEPYRVYGGAQDNGVWVGPSDYKASDEWQQTGQYPYQSLLSGDGMQVQVDTRDNNTVYTGFQFGNYFRVNRSTGATKPIGPRHELGERPLRFNWQTPIWLSRHQQDVLYMGANKLYRSFDQGEHWEAISGDLTHGGQTGNVPYGTLTSIHESPLKFGLLYAGSDDGLLHVTRDGGETWTRISDSLPAKLWVSRVQASAHERGRVYVSLSGYRWDDFRAYLYASEDYGQHWQQIGLDLPVEPINVVREDPVNPDLLYVGTDHGLYLSLDRGRTFQALGGDFPAVPVHDLVIQSRSNDLV
ncbi:MAG: glycosyl hydrolase, partial [Saprospiraceae bacterium]